MPESRIFTAGGTVQAAGGLYIARKVDDRLLDLCTRGEFAFVLTARQMGKSSLMVRTAERLRERRTHAVIIDLSQLGVQVTPAEWYLGILTTVEDALDLDTDVYDWWEEHEQVGLSQRLTQFFEEVVMPEVEGDVVIFFDEIDSTLSLDFTDDFFASIRYIYNARAHISAFKRLSFVLIGVATPSDLIEDPKRTPFNVGHRVDLNYFTHEEAMPLARGFDLPEEKARDVLDSILRWTSGHPFLTQRLALAVSGLDSKEITERHVDRAVQATFFGEKSEEDSNLRFVHDMLTHRAPDPTAVLTMYEDVLNGKRVEDKKQSHTVSHLKLSGIVRGESGALVIQNAIYRRVFDKEWLKKQWPEHWLKRVPPAVRGLVAASFLALILLGVVFVQNARRAEAQRFGTEMATLNEQLVEQRDETEAANSRLAEALDRSDSLRQQTEQANDLLSDQIRVTDSLRLKETRLNEELLAQFRVIDSLRAEEAVANQKLSSQVAVSDSLRAIAFDRLEAARLSRLETIAVALAGKASRLIRLGDPELGALLARQAYAFGAGSSGEFRAPVYDALREALNAVGNPAKPLGGPAVTTEHDGPVLHVVYSPDGRWLASAGEDGRIGIAPTDARDRTRTRYVTAHAGGVRKLCFGGDPLRLFSAGEDGTVKIWSDFAEGRPTARQLARHDEPVWAIAVSSDGRFVASGTRSGAVTVTDLAGAQNRAAFTLSAEAGVRSLAFLVDRDAIAVGLDNGELAIWRFNDPSADVQRIDTRHLRVLAVVVSPDGHRLATGGADKMARVWRITSGTIELDPIRLAGHEGPVNAVAFSSDARMLVTASSDQSAQLWAASDETFGNPILLQDHTSWVLSASFSPDAKRLATASADHKVRIWHTRIEELADQICSAVAGREMTPDDWMQYVGRDFEFNEEYVPCRTQATASRILWSNDNESYKP